MKTLKWILLVLVMLTMASNFAYLVEMPDGVALPEGGKVMKPLDQPKDADVAPAMVSAKQACISCKDGCEDCDCCDNCSNNNKEREKNDEAFDEGMDGFGIFLLIILGVLVVFLVGCAIASCA